jgi:hypothetical protein
MLTLWARYVKVFLYSRAGRISLREPNVGALPSAVKMIMLSAVPGADTAKTIHLT